MKTFTINDSNEIVAIATPEEAAATTATPFDSFASEQELAELAKAWPGSRMVEIWNSLPGVTAVKKFKNSKAAIRRIWARIQNLGGSTESEVQQLKEPKAAAKAKGGARAAKGAPEKAKASKKATPAKGAPKAKKTPKGESSLPREGSKMAQVIAMLQRKNGATLAEISEKMGWQAHTVRGFMAGAMKKAGHTVESFKPEGGERTYRIGK